MKQLKGLSRRERQIMDIIYELKEAPASAVQERLPGSPSYSTVRALLKILEEKGHLNHKKEGLRYVFFPVVPKEKAKENALRRVLRTFFDNSTENMVASLLNISEEKLSDKDYKRLLNLIDEAKKQGR